MQVFVYKNHTVEVVGRLYDLTIYRITNKETNEYMSKVFANDEHVKAYIDTYRGDAK